MEVVRARFFPYVGRKELTILRPFLKGMRVVHSNSSDVFEVTRSITETTERLFFLSLSWRTLR